MSRALVAHGDCPLHRGRPTRGEAFGSSYATRVELIHVAFSGLFPSVLAIVGLAFVLACGFLLVILSCALYQNWYPLLVVTTYVLAPLPNFLCSRCGGGGDELLLGDGNSGFQDAGRFITSILIVTGFGLPLVLAHAAVINTAAMILSISGGLLVYGTIIAYSRFFASDGDLGFY